MTAHSPQFPTMRNLFTLCLFFAFSAAAFAQQSHDITHIEARPAHLPTTLTGDKTAGIVDTLFDYYDRSTQFYLLTAGAGGYTLGTSSISRETGVHYTGLGITRVTELMVFFTAKEVMFGAADSLVAKFYDTTADSMPNTVLGSGKVSLNDIDTSGFATFIPIQGIDSTSGDFFVSIDYYDDNNIDDSVAILSNNVLSSNGGPDGQGERRTRQKLNNDSWLTAWDIWNFGGSPMDADAMILPIVDYSEVVGIENAVRARELTMSTPYPQPAQHRLTIPFSLDKGQRADLVVFDPQGRPVQEVAAKSYPAGESSIDLPTSNLSAGVYYFRLQAERGTLAGKFLVQ